MIIGIADQINQRIEPTTKWTSYPVIVEEKCNPRLDILLKDLSPEIAWGNREIAAKKLGNLRDPEALPGLLDALKNDNFWMVRCAIIQALEKIGDNRAIPALVGVADRDSFQVVRSYAAKAVERLSQGGEPLPLE